jgi:hypothetical protein
MGGRCDFRGKAWDAGRTAKAAATAINNYNKFNDKYQHFIPSNQGDVIDLDT